MFKLYVTLNKISLHKKLVTVIFGMVYPKGKGGTKQFFLYEVQTR